jgi:hypothetical protein
MKISCPWIDTLVILGVDKTDSLLRAGFLFKEKVMQCRSTVARLIQVAAELSNPGGATIRELSERLEVSTKTLYRDRDFLRDRLGLTIELELVDAPAKRHGIEYRHRASNAGEVLPLISTLGRMVL